MSVTEPEIAENLTNGIITEEQNTTENNEQILSTEQNYDETQNNDEISLNNVDNEVKPEATTDNVKEIISNTTEHVQESVSTTQTESVEIHRTVTQTEVHGQVIQEIQDQEPLQSIQENPTVNEESSEVVTENKEELKLEDDQKVSTFSKKEDTDSSQIQEESLRNKLHEIIQEISFEVQDENEPRSHTWKPKGKYEVPKTEIKYEEIVPCKVPDVDIQERAKAAEKEKKSGKKPPKKENLVSQSEETEQQQTFTEETRYQHSIDAQKILRHTVVNGEPLSPQEIPIGIPLLAKVLPKDESGDEEPREKIPLERLFTPASDAENLIPLKKKRAFASSCFYRPDHPTIDDQVELAHKISISLIDENNKSSRGQTMYMKRKNRSSKWIHEGGAPQSQEAWQQQQETSAQEEKYFKGKPQLKLVLSPKKVQDFSAVQKHYEELMATSIESTRHITRMEVGKEIATHLESPTGKGAALFAKRKKRMDKFIVDESTIQQQQQQDQQQQQQNDTVTSQQSNFSSEQNNTFLTSESNSIVQQNGFQSNHDISFGTLNATDQEGAIYKAEVTLVEKPLSASSAFDLSAPLPLHKIINEDDFPAKKEDRRKSFNLAPKGWGTYNNFYTPVHLEAK